MTLFADILLAVLTAVLPEHGVTVPMLSPEQASYMALPEGELLKAVAEDGVRPTLSAAPSSPQSVRLAWRGATETKGRMKIVARGSSVAESFEVSGSGCRLTNLEPGRRYSWAVAFGKEKAGATFSTAPQLPRLLRLEGVSNVRDLGGWLGLDGRRVRFGWLLRSGTLRGEGNERGLVHLKGSLGVRTDIELRDVREPLCFESSALGPEACWVVCGLAAYDRIDAITYGRESFAKICRILAAADSFPVLIHCDTGRDRTGTVAFLVLGLLGVSREDALHDWAASAFGAPKGSLSVSRIRALESYLATLGPAAFVDQCVQYARGCGVTDDEIAAIRANLLEKEALR